MRDFQSAADGQIDLQSNHIVRGQDQFWLIVQVCREVFARLGYNVGVASFGSVVGGGERGPPACGERLPTVGSGRGAKYSRRRDSMMVLADCMVVSPFRRDYRSLPPQSQVLCRPGRHGGR